MHVQTNYSLQLASMGVGREDVQEIAARRAAEARRRLAAVRRGPKLEDEDAVVGTTAVERSYIHSEVDTYSNAEVATERSTIELSTEAAVEAAVRVEQPGEGVFGSLFSARA